MCTDEVVDLGREKITLLIIRHKTHVNYHIKKPGGRDPGLPRGEASVKPVINPN